MHPPQGVGPGPGGGDVEGREATGLTQLHRLAVILGGGALLLEPIETDREIERVVGVVPRQAIGVEVSRLWPFKESELRMLECCLADFCLRLDLIIAGEPQPAPHPAADPRP